MNLIYSGISEWRICLEQHEVSCFSFRDSICFPYYGGSTIRDINFYIMNIILYMYTCRSVLEHTNHVWALELHWIWSSSCSGVLWPWAGIYHNCPPSFSSVKVIYWWTLLAQLGPAGNKVLLCWKCTGRTGQKVWTDSSRPCHPGEVLRLPSAKHSWHWIYILHVWWTILSIA